MKDRLLTPPEVAELCQLTTKRLAEWRSTGREGPPYVKLGRAVRYLEADVVRWVEAQKRSVEGSAS